MKRMIVAAIISALVLALIAQAASESQQPILDLTGKDMPSIEDRPYPFLKFKQGDIQGISSVSGSITKGEFKNAEIVFKDGGGIKFNGRKFVLKPGAQVTIDGDTIRFRNDASFILDNKEFKAEGGEVKVDAKKGQDPKFSLGKDSSIKAGSQSLLSKDGASLVYSKDGFLLENGAVNFKTEEGVDVRVSRISAAPDSRPLFTDDGVRLPKGSRADTIGTDGKTISSSFVPLKDQVWLADSKANYDKISGDKKVYFKSPDDIRFDRGVTALFSDKGGDMLLNGGNTYVNPKVIMSALEESGFKATTDNGGRVTSIEGMGGKARIMGALHGESIGSILKADEGSFKILGKDGAHLYTVQEMDNNKGHYKVYDAKTGQLIEGGKDLTKEGLASLFERKDLIDSHFVSDPKGMASDVADYLSGGKKWDLSSASRAAAPREYSVQVSSVQEISRGSMPSAASPETKFSPAQVKGLEELEDVRFTRYYTPEFGSLDEFLDDWSLGKKKSATRVEGWARVHLTEEQAAQRGLKWNGDGIYLASYQSNKKFYDPSVVGQMGLGNKNNPLEQWTVAVNKYNPRAKSGDKIVVKYYRDGSWFTKKFPIADHGSKPDLDFNAGWALVKKVNGRYVPVKPLDYPWSGRQEVYYVEKKWQA